MFSFVFSLAVLSVMFTLISGAAYIYRRVFMKGRERMMYPVWLIVLAISVIPLRIDLPAVEHNSVYLDDSLADTDPTPEYLGDYSEIERAERVYAAKANADKRISVIQNERSMLYELHRFVIRSAFYIELISAVLLAVWLAGAIIKFTRSMSEYYSAKQLMRMNSSICLDKRLAAALEKCRLDIGVKTHLSLRVFSDESICSPCVCGCIRPTLYLEPGCSSLSDKELECVLAHELYHIRRHDMLLKLFSQLVASIHWLNPMSKVVLRYVYEDCELSCDANVIRVYGRAVSGMYMNTILDFAERFSDNSRLVGVTGIGSGMFIAPRSGAGFLKRRYANMKNFKKRPAAAIAAAIFCLTLAVANIFVLSSCSSMVMAYFVDDIKLSAPLDQMVRTYYGLSQDDPITTKMLDGITSLSIVANDEYEGHILADFVVNNEYGYAEALPHYVMKDYWDSTIEVAADSLRSKGGEYDIFGDGRILNADNLISRMNAFYLLRDPNNPALDEQELNEMCEVYPVLLEKGALYFFDPYATPREITSIYKIFDVLGLVDPWEIDSYEFDASSLIYFTNLTEVEFVGFTPVNYAVPDDVNMVVGTEPSKDYETQPAADFSVGNVKAEPIDLDRYISERFTYDYKEPADGSVVTIPVNESLNAALREYFIMDNWHIEDTPLTSRHMERITSIKAEFDDELTKIILAADGEGIFKDSHYIRYTINGYTLDIIPQYYSKESYELLIGGVTPNEELVKASYEWSDEFDCYMLKDDVTYETKLKIFTDMVNLEMMKVAIVGKTGSGNYLSQFMTSSSYVEGIVSRFLDTVESFDESDKELFVNLDSWEIAFDR